MPVIRRGSGEGSRSTRWLAEQRDRLAERLEFEVGADGGELGDARAARVAAEGLQVVPQEAGGIGFQAPAARTSRVGLLEVDLLDARHALAAVHQDAALDLAAQHGRASRASRRKVTIE
jgi:hypothetical protein